MTTEAGGDRVRFEDYQRADRPDVEALGSLPFDYLSRAFGMLVGIGQGSFTQIEFDVSNLSAVSIGSCVLYYGCELPNNQVHGILLRHDATLGSQTSTVDLSTYQASSTLAYIWAKKVFVEMDLATRRKYDTGTDAEISDPQNTRNNERVQWGAGTGEPDGSGGWFRVAQISAWSSGVPTITTLHPFDREVLSSDVVGFRSMRRLFGTAVGNNVGLIQAFWAITDQLTGIASSTSPTALTTSWYSTVSRGLRELYLYQQQLLMQARHVALSGGVAITGDWAPDGNATWRGNEAPAITGGRLWFDVTPSWDLTTGAGSTKKVQVTLNPGNCDVTVSLNRMRVPTDPSAIFVPEFKGGAAMETDSEASAASVAVAAGSGFQMVELEANNSAFARWAVFITITATAGSGDAIVYSVRDASLPFDLPAPV